MTAMLRRPVVMLLGVVAALAACGDGRGAARQTPSAPAPAAPPRAVARLLVVTHTTGFRHDSIPAAETAVRELGVESGLFQPSFCRTAEEVRAGLSVAGLAAVDAVFFANTTGDLGIPDVQAFVDWVGAGNGFLGAHSAADTYHGSAAFLAMLGGEFTAHGAIVEADVRVTEPGNSVVAHLAPGFRIADEWYRFRPAGPAPTVLLHFDRNPPDGLGVPAAPVTLPLAWQKRHGTGRVFYTALGHRTEVWQDPRFRKHLLEAVRWVLGGQS